MTRQEIKDHLKKKFSENPDLIEKVEGIASTKQAKEALIAKIVSGSYMGKSQDLFCSVLSAADPKVTKRKK